MSPKGKKEKLNGQQRCKTTSDHFLTIPYLFIFSKRARICHRYKNKWTTLGFKKGNTDGNKA